MEEDRSALKTLTGNPTEKILLERLSRRWEDNIRMVLKEIEDNRRNWVDSAKGKGYLRALTNTALNLRVPQPWS